MACHASCNGSEALWDQRRGSCQAANGGILAPPYIEPGLSRTESAQLVRAPPRLAKSEAMKLRSATFRQTRSRYALPRFAARLAAVESATRRIFPNRSASC